MRHLCLGSLPGKLCSFRSFCLPFNSEARAFTLAELAFNALIGSVKLIRASLRSEKNLALSFNTWSCSAVSVLFVYVLVDAGWEERWRINLSAIAFFLAKHVTLCVFHL